MPGLFVTNYITPNQSSFFRESDWTILTTGQPEAGRRSWLSQEVGVAGAHVDSCQTLGISGLTSAIRRANCTVVGSSIRDPWVYVVLAIATTVRKPTGLWLERLRRPTRRTAAILRIAATARNVRVLGIGSMAVAQYASLLGRRAEVVNFPYSYGKPVPDSVAPFPSSSDKPRFVTFANPSHRKGVDLVEAALCQMERLHPSVESPQVLAVGLGPEEAEGFPHLTPIQQVPHAQVQQMISDSYGVILASRFDGWGVVVEEAARLGRPSIVSERVGAIDLLGSGGGVVVSTIPDFVGSLQSAIRYAIEDREAWAHHGLLARQAAKEHVASFTFESLEQVLCA